MFCRARAQIEILLKDTGFCVTATGNISNMYAVGQATAWRLSVVALFSATILALAYFVHL